MKLFGLRNCDSCRKAMRWLDRHGVRYAFIDLRADPPGAGQIERWLATGQGAALVNRRSTTWRQLPEAQRARADSEPAALLSEQPTLMKRPVLTGGRRLLAVGFAPDRFEALFAADP